MSYGTTPSYDGADPVKNGDAQYSYAWTGWSPSVTTVSGDVTYTATFNSVIFDNASSNNILMSRTSNKPSDINSFSIISDYRTFDFETSNSSNFTNGLLTLNDGGTMYNLTAINGICNINVTFTGSLTISYGWYYNGKINYEVFDEALVSGSTYSFRNNDKPSYIKIISSTTTNISQIEIEYKNLLSFNRYEEDGILCANSDKWINYGCEGNVAYVDSTIKSTTGINDFNVRIRHWYNGRPVTTIKTVSYQSHSGKIISSGVINYYTYSVNRAAFSDKATSIFIPNTITSLTEYIFYGFAGSIYIEFSSSSEASQTCIMETEWNSYNFEYDYKYPYPHDFKYSDVIYNVNYGPNNTLDGLNYYVLNDDTVKIFGYSESERNITIPNEIDGYTSIILGKNCFKGTNITSIILSDSVIDIEEGAFENCINLLYADLSSAIVNQISKNMFYGCTSLEEVKINKTLTGIGSYAFYKCSSLTSFDFENIVSIGSYAFAHSALNIASFGFSLETLGSNAFYNCQSLTTIDMSSSKLMEISTKTFYGCTSLEEVKINKTLTSIGSYAFYNCQSLTAVDMSSSKLMEISNYAFYNCSSLDNVIIPDLVNSIGSNAFVNCSSLNVLVLGKGMMNQTLYASSFANSPCLKDAIYFAGSVEEWNTITINGTLNCINFYSDTLPTDEMISLLPQGSLYWHYVNSVPTLW